MTKARVSQTASSMMRGGSSNASRLRQHVLLLCYRWREGPCSSERVPLRIWPNSVVMADGLMMSTAFHMQAIRRTRTLGSLPACVLLQH